MTDKYTLEEIEKAFVSGLESCGFRHEDASIEHLEEMVKSLTCPKPEFAIGQVVISGEHGLWQRQPLRLLKIGDDISALGTFDYRPLNQQEVGPDWVPKEPVKALRDAMEDLLARYNEHDVITHPVLERITTDALAAFDAAIET